MVLLVVDAQNGIVDERLYEFRKFVGNIKKLIGAAREQGIEVIYVQHDDGPDTGFSIGDDEFEVYSEFQTSVYKGYKRDKIEMRVDRVEVSDFPLYLNTVAGGLDRRDQTIGGFSFVVKIYAVPVVEIIG